MWVARSEPQPATSRSTTGTAARRNHVGIVERATGDGSFSAIEGNTSIASDSDGGEVMRRDRTPPTSTASVA